MPTTISESQKDPKFESSAYLAYLSNTEEARQSRAYDDKLSKTFDLQAHDEEM